MAASHLGPAASIVAGTGACQSGNCISICRICGTRSVITAPVLVLTPSHISPSRLSSDAAT